MKWIELSVEVHPEAVDAVANVFHEQGTGGVAIEQTVSAHIEGEDEPRLNGLPRVRAFIPVNDKADQVERAIERDLWHLQAFNLSPVGPLSRREIEEDDWAEGWKEHFHPLKIGKIVIKPSWREWSPSEGEIVVELDPGMAFGTGLHPTTKLMLAALQELVRPGDRVLDLGTGSGILAIPSAKLGAQILALDISDVAVEVARDNVARNAVPDHVGVDAGTIEDTKGREFDVILANIIASVLIDIAPRLRDRLSPQGVVLASGIVSERLADVREAFERAGLMIQQERRDEDWYLLMARPRAV